MQEYALAAAADPAVVVAAVAAAQVQAELPRGFDLLGLPSALAAAAEDAGAAGVLAGHAGRGQQGELRSRALALQQGRELLPDLSVILRVGEVEVWA